jgi:hypothetical protein
MIYLIFNLYYITIMVDIISKDHKYNKSKLGFNCLGPCYEPGTYVIHPITLNYVFDKDYPFCHVNEFLYVDPETGKKQIRYHDRCYNPTKDKDQSAAKKLKATNMLLPFIEFKCDQFLKIYNNIFTFEDAVLWIEKKKQSPINTRARIFECAMESYGKDIDIIDQQLSGFLIEYVSVKWIDSIYDKINKYIEIKDDKIKLVNKTNPNNEFEDEKKSYIISKFINSDEIHKFMIKYIKHRKSEWSTIENHLERMKSDYLQYIENKVKITVGIVN